MQGGNLNLEKFMNVRSRLYQLNNGQLVRFSFYKTWQETRVGMLVGSLKNDLNLGEFRKFV